MNAAVKVFTDLDTDTLAERRLARRLFGREPVRLHIVQAGQPLRELSAEEWATMAHAYSKRIDDFRRGRHVAHRLLQDLQQPCASLLNDKAGIPNWPQNIVASLSHTQSLAIACGADSGAIRSLGIDAELGSRRLDPSAWPYVFSLRECEALNGLPPERRGDWALRLFSLKESAYKATYHALQRRLALTRIDAVPQSWDEDADVILTVPGQLPMRGRHCRFGAHIVSAVVMLAV